MKGEGSVIEATEHSCDVTPSNYNAILSSRLKEINPIISPLDSNTTAAATVRATGISTITIATLLSLPSLLA